jgi:predicted oxidoreductase
MSRKLGCNITDEEKALLDRLTEKLDKTQGELIGLLIRNYHNHLNHDSVISLKAFHLSGSEQLEVENALTNSDSQLDEVARDGLLQRARYLNSIADKQAQLESMSDEEMQKATFKGAANFRIEQMISTIINHNNNQSEKSRKVCLTKGIIFKLTGSNRQTINKYFDEHEVMISDHNHKHSLTDADNRKGKGFSFEQLLGIE